jgi:hypothetical protein
MGDTRSEHSTPFGSIAAAVVLLGIFTADCLTQLNLSIVYARPLVAFGRRLSGIKFAALTALLVALTVRGYVIKTTSFLTSAPPLVSYRLLNRSLVASILVLTAIALHSLCRRVGERTEHDDFDRLLHSVSSLLVALLGAVAAAAILAADLLTPGEYNVPILYGVPIVLIAAAGSERLIWLSAIGLALLSVLGFVAGPAPDVAPGFLKWAVVNRSLAVCAVFGLAFLLRHVTRASHRTSPPSAVDAPLP